MIKRITKHLHSALCIVLVALSCSSLMPGKAFSATDGALSSTSTGTVAIEVDKPAQVKISGMTDMTLASWKIGDGDQAMHSDVCIYSTSGAYTLVANGSGTSNAFTLTDGLGTTTLHKVPYTVKWDDAGVGAIGVGAGTTVTAASTAAPFTHASVDSADCTGGAAAGKNARVNIAMTEADLVKLASGTFLGTLTLIVAPN